VIVIVHSNYRAANWKEDAEIIATADNLVETVQRLVSGHVGLVVLVNRYDGIDLPKDACRILVLDGTPDARRFCDRLEDAALAGTTATTRTTMQLVEQGMGRGIRSNDDYCVVLLMGRSLVKGMFADREIERLTPATRAQFEYSESLAEQIRGQGIDSIRNAMSYCLKRDAEWVAQSRSVLIGLKYDVEADDMLIAERRRASFTAAASGDRRLSVSALQEAINHAGDDKTKGWLKFQLAEIVNSYDNVESQVILRSASSLNRHLPVRPQAGVEYIRMNPIASDQAALSLKFARESYRDANHMVIAAHSVADDLAFRPNSFRSFERALADAAFLLGFNPQRPEDEFGKGPDVLWSVGALRYFVIECKNEATTDTVSKTYSNQLAGSLNWFRQEYDQTCAAVPILVHPSAVFEFAATPPPGAKVINKDKLPQFREALLDYCIALSLVFDRCTANDVVKLLSAYHLTPEQIVNYFTVNASVSQR
jgi:hypothetical protein